MQRFYNAPDLIVDDMVKGYVKAHGDLVRLSNENDRVVVSRHVEKGKVTVVSGGGSGHEPCFLGYVGKNMLDAVAVGEVFSSPTALAFHQAIKEVDQGSGVAVLFGNYAGDNMNVKMAVQMAAMDDIEVKYVTANDDVASSPKEEKEKRHGIAGSLFMWKLACAKAALGGTLDEVIETAQSAVNHTRSICVGLSPCSIPAVGHANFKIEEGTMEYGIGHHGEPGVDVRKLEKADKIADDLCSFICSDIDVQENDEVSIIVSGLGSTPLMELYVLYNEVEQYFAQKGVKVYKAFVGNYVTSLEMNGAALTVLKMKEEYKELLDLPIETAGLTIR